MGYRVNMGFNEYEIEALLNSDLILNYEKYSKQDLINIVQYLRKNNLFLKMQVQKLEKEKYTKIAQEYKAEKIKNYGE